MVCLVTGGAGFIGSNLVSLLLKEGHSVRILDNLSSGYRVNVPLKDVEFIIGDVRDFSMVEKCLNGIDTVFHLAASVGNSRSIEHPFIDSSVNYGGTLNILEASRRKAVQNVVFSSSAGVFGELKTMPIAEDHPAEPDTPYGASKLGAEKMALAYAKLYKINVVALRYFNVYGMNQRFDEYGNVIPKFVFRLLKGQKIHIFGNGEQTRDFVNSKDVAMANYLGAKGLVSGAFNIGSGTSVTINTLAKMIVSEIGGSTDQVVYSPPRAGDVLHSQAAIKKASEAFGFNPSIPLVDGIRNYVQWAKRDVEAFAS
jgi:UDP-glucose 4-epimerase